MGINVTVAAIEGTRAFQQMAGDKSWNQLSYQLKQQILLTAILEQANSKYGNAIANTTQNGLTMFTAKMKDVALNIGQGFIPILQAATPLINAFANTLLYASSIFSQLSRAFFGVTKEQQFFANTQIDTGVAAKSAAAGQNSLTDAMKKANAEAKRGIAAFDEINEIQESTGKSGADADMGGVGDIGNTVNPPLMDFGVPISEQAYLAIDTLRSKIDKLKETLRPTTEALIRLGEALIPVKDFTYQGIKDFYTEVLEPIGKWVLGEGLPRFINAFSEGLEKIDYETIQTNLKGVFTAVTPFAVNVGEGLLWFWENVLTPMGTWVTNNIVPVFLQAVQTALQLLNATLEGLKPYATWLWTEWLQPLGQWTGGAAASILTTLKDALKGLGDWAKENKETLANLTIGIAAFFGAWKVVELMAFIQASGGVAAAFTAITTALWAATGAKVANKIETIALTLLYAKDFVVAIWKTVTGAAAATAGWIANTASLVAAKVAAIASTVATKAMTVAQWALNAALDANPISLVIIAVAALTAGIIYLWNNNEDFRKACIESWEKIKEIFGIVKDFLVDEVWPKILEAWEGIKEGFSKLKEGIDTIWTGFKDALGAIKDFFVKDIGGPISDIWKITLDAFDALYKGINESWVDFKTLLTNIKDFFIDDVGGAIGSAWDGISKAVSTVGNTIGTVFDGIKKNVTSAVNFVIGGVNTFIRGVNSISIKIPQVELPFGGGTVGGGTIGFPRINEIPELARGGIVNKPTIAQIGEAGSEVVMPLENTPFVDKLAGAVGTAVMKAMEFVAPSQNQQHDVILKINDTEIARATYNAYQKESNRRGYVAIRT